MINLWCPTPFALSVTEVNETFEATSSILYYTVHCTVYWGDFLETEALRRVNVLQKRWDFSVTLYIVC